MIFNTEYQLGVPGSTRRIASSVVRKKSDVGEEMKL
jgi:hypothetical protein